MQSSGHLSQGVFAEKKNEIFDLLNKDGITYNYSEGWNTKHIRNSGSPLFRFPMAFGFPIVLRFEQNGLHFVHIPNGAILFGFPVILFRNGRNHSYSYCFDPPSQNWPIRNLNFKTFGIPMYLVFQCLIFKPSLYSIQGWDSLSTTVKVFSSSIVFCWKVDNRKLR